MKKCRSVLLSQLDTFYPTATNLGHIILLSGTMGQQTFVATTPPSGNTLTVPSISNLGNGTIVRLVSTGTLPTGLSLGTDYWVDTTLGVTGLRLSPSYQQFIDGFYTPYDDAGTGVHTMVEQSFTEQNFVRGWLTKEALLNKELTHPDYVRKIINFANPATFDPTELYAINTQQAAWTRSNPATFSFGYLLTMLGSLDTIGDLTGNLDSLHVYTTPRIVNNTQSITVEFVNG